MRQGETYPDSASVDALPPPKTVYPQSPHFGYVPLLTNFFSSVNPGVAQEGGGGKVLRYKEVP